MKCPNCGTESDGRFCPSCGTPLAGANCASCKARLLPGARYCTQCGTTVRAQATSATSLPWVIAGAAIVVAIAAVLLPSVRGQAGGSSDTGGATPPFAGGGTGQPPPLTGTPREQADRLFDRIMQEKSAGNEERARFFVPMAIQAYQAAGVQDADGLYHLSLIHAVGGDFAAARAAAEELLRSSPTHLLGLAALAEAAQGAGDTAAARQAWRRFLDNLDSEKARQLPEYTSHAPILDDYEQQARRAVGS